MYSSIIDLENEFLKVSIKKLGAELCSLFSKEISRELLWQADAKFWSRHAPILFPIVGKVKESTSSLSQHGFARDMTFMVLKEEATEVLFRLQSSDETKKNYPFEFILDVHYQLEGNKLIMKISVHNSGPSVLPFSLGLHPGFITESAATITAQTLPLESYRLKNGFLDTKVIASPFKQNKLVIDDNTFKDDALIFKNVTSQKIVLNNSDHAISVSNGSAPYLAFWSKLGAAFVCIEPWYGIHDAENFIGDFSDKEGLVKLDSQRTFTDTFEIEFNRRSY